MWFLYALIGAFFKSLSGYNRKRVAHLSSTVFTWIYFSIAVIALLPFILVFQLPIFSLLTEHILIALGISLTSIIGMLLNVKALRKDELSFVAPLNGLIPLIGVVFALLFLGELPPILGIIGVVVIFIGTYIMALQSPRVTWYDPLLRLSRSRAAQLSLGVAVFYTLNTIFIKAATNEGYDALTILYAMSLIGALLLSPILLTNKRHEIIPALRRHPKHLFASAINSLLGSYFHNMAVSLTFVGYALAVRRFDTVFSVLLGLKFLNESNIKNKLIGATVIVGGSALIALYT